MEFCEKGTLTSLLEKRKLDSLLKLKIALDCAHGMNFLHQSGILHRDLKPDNLLVVSTSIKSPVRVKLTDFGSSRSVTEVGERQKTKGVGTPVYMAPEQLKGEEYSFPSDVFAFGVNLWQIWNQKSPFLSFFFFEKALLTFFSS